MVADYKNDEEFRRFCGMLDGLAFLPVCDVAAGLQHLREVATAVPLVDYFDTTYVNGTCRPAPVDSTTAEPRRRIRPRFPPELWNVHQLTVDNKDRTNNSAEAWNRRFESMLGHSHPSIWTVIEMLRADAAEAGTTLAKHESGNVANKRRRRGTELTQKRLVRLCQEYVSKERNLAEFLLAVGYQIRFT